jgi:hypothetical protein
MNVSPVVLFTYNRINHTKSTINALKKNILSNLTDLIIFSDGAKTNVDSEKVIELRKYLHTIDGFKSIRIIEREYNIGLSNNIIDGVTKVCNDFGKVIVLEDDLITSPFFLTFMNEAINKYINNPKVCSIHGYVYPVNIELPNTFFIKGADCWGWATWTKAWNFFEKDGSKLLSEIRSKKLEKEFNFQNSYDYISMLEDQINGINNSWAIRWYASCFLNDLYTLYPGKSLVTNIGFDDSGTHSGNSIVFNQNRFLNKITINNIPVITNNIAYFAFIKYFNKHKFYNCKFKKMVKKIYKKFNSIISIN